MYCCSITWRVHLPLLFVFPSRPNVSAFALSYPLASVLRVHRRSKDSDHAGDIESDSELSGDVEEAIVGKSLTSILNESQPNTHTTTTTNNNSNNNRQTCQLRAVP